MPRTVILLFLTLLAGADWPRFRGPNGTGRADAAGPTDLAKSLAWRVDLEPGHGSPVVHSGKLFIPTSSADGSRRELLCLDAASGRKLWSLGRPGAKAPTHRKNSLASSTPAADGERIVHLFWDGASLELVAVSHAGQELWSRPLGGYRSEHGAGPSPILHAGRVFLNNDQDGSAKIQAFDARTGEPLWSVDRVAHFACYSSPLIHEVDGHAQLIVTSSAAVTAYDPATGRRVWEHPWDWSYLKDPLRTVGSSIVADGLIIAAAGNGGGNSATLALRPPSAANAQPQLVWDRKKGMPYVPTFLADGANLYTVSDRGVAGCYEARSGQERWTHRLGGGFTASPILAGGHIYAVSEDGTVTIFKAGPAYEQIARHPLGELTHATPAIADGRLYVRSAQAIFCFAAPR